MKLESLKHKYLLGCQKVGAFFSAPSRTQAQAMLFVVGTGLLVGGLMHDAVAQVVGGGGIGTLGGGAAGGKVGTTYNDVRIADSTNAVLTYLEGSFGALVMVASGIGAILSAAFGQYRAALGLMVVAIGSFILRSLMGTFFNDTNIQG